MIAGSQGPDHVQGLAAQSVVSGPAVSASPRSLMEV